MNGKPLLALDTLTRGSIQGVYQTTLTYPRDNYVLGGKGVSAQTL
jgi:hypothetical protein